MSKVVQLPVGELKWVTIAGDGKDRKGENDKEPKFKYEASIRYKEGSPEALAIMEIFDDVWELYRESNSKIKSATKPKSLGYKIETIKDEDTGADVPTGYIIVTSNTNAKWKDGSNAPMSLLDGDAATLDKDAFDIGNGTIGTIYVQPAGYEYQGTFGITSYLNTVQIIVPTLKATSNSEAEVTALSYEAPVEGETPTGV